MECGFLQSVTSWAVKTFRDGGLRGWLAVLGLFSTWMVWITLIKGLAVMLPTLQEQFNTSTWLVGWIIAIIDASVECSAVFASPLRALLGVRAVIMMSGVLISGSLIASSFASSLSDNGPAIGCSNIVTREVIARCFNESRTTAFGVGILGGSLAFVTCVPLTQLFLDIYGWRGTMLLLGAMVSNLAVCGALMKEPAAARRNDEYQTVPVDEEPKVTRDGETTSNSRCCSCLSSIYLFISKTFKLGLLSSLPFWLIIFMLNIWMMTCAAWVIYFVVYTTVTKGVSLHDASNFVVCYGIGRILGSITVGPLVKNIKAVSDLLWLGLGLLVLSLYYFIDPWLMSDWSIFGAAFIYGYFKVMTHIQFDLVIIEVFGANQMGFVLGWNGVIAGVTRLLTLYFPGLIYDHFGSYTLAFMLMGGVQFLGVVALLALVLLLRQRRGPARL